MPEDTTCEQCQDRHIRIGIMDDKMKHFAKLYDAMDALRINHEHLRLTLEKKFSTMYVSLAGIFGTLAVNILMMYFKQ